MPSPFKQKLSNADIPFLLSRKLNWYLLFLLLDIALFCWSTYSVVTELLQPNNSSTAVATIIVVGVALISISFGKHDRHQSAQKLMVAFSRSVAYLLTLLLVAINYSGVQQIIAMFLNTSISELQVTVQAIIIVASLNAVIVKIRAWIKWDRL